MHICFFFFFLQGTPRAFSREVQKRFFKGEKKAAVRQMPAASTNAYRHAGEIGGHEGWICHGASYRKKQTNQTAARKLTCTDMGESLDMHVMYSPHSHTLVMSTN